MKKVKLTIQGMHCASCASNVERSLKRIDGVKECSVNVLTKKGMVECEESVSSDQLKKAVERTGYKVVQID